MTNREFAKNEDFIRVCKRVGVKPTVRQASKFRNYRGAAHNSLASIHHRE